MKQGCLLNKPSDFSLLVSEVADFVREMENMAFSYFLDIKKLSYFCLQMILFCYLPHLPVYETRSTAYEMSQSLGLTVHLDKTKVMVAGTGYITAREKCLYSGNEIEVVIDRSMVFNAKSTAEVISGRQIEVVNSYKYLGYTLTTTLSSDCACEDYASGAKGKVPGLMKTMWSPGSLNTRVFVPLLDIQSKPIYASEMWGTVRLNLIECTHLFACKRLFSVSDKTSNHMVYGDT